MHVKNRTPFLHIKKWNALQSMHFIFQNATHKEEENICLIKCPFITLNESKQVFMKNPPIFFMLGKDLKGDHCGKSRPMFNSHLIKDLNSHNGLVLGPYLT
jgi:hypothetical protein